jgi:hypothetical protein
MLHIPEDELHAYLDQSLSRSQCVEIESHLASCPMCQSQRDGIAALRDRTTALLSLLAPAMTLPPSFETIRSRARGVAHGRQRMLRVGFWAASVVVALGLGWTAHVWLDSRQGTASHGGAAGRNTASGSRPEAAAAQLSSEVSDSARPSSSLPHVSRMSRHRRTTAALPRRDSAAAPIRDIDSGQADRLQAPAPNLAVTPLPPSPIDSTNTKFAASNSSGLGDDRELTELAPESMWRLVSVAAAEEESGAPLPSVPGLPVVQVKVQGVQPNQKIVAVDQQLASGQYIRTIEGPADQMADLLARDDQHLFPGSVAANASRALDMLMTMRFGDRMVAIRGPADSVRALMNRIPVPQKKKP